MQGWPGNVRHGCHIYWRCPRMLALTPDPVQGLIAPPLPPYTRLHLLRRHALGGPAQRLCVPPVQCAPAPLCAFRPRVWSGGCRGGHGGGSGTGTSLHAGACPDRLLPPPFVEAVRRATLCCVCRPHSCPPSPPKPTSPNASQTSGASFDAARWATVAAGLIGVALLGYLGLKI